MATRDWTQEEVVEVVMERHYYETYPGGVITGELVHEITKAPDTNGNVLMTQEEYDNSYSRIGREMRGHPRYHEEYDVTNNGAGGLVVLHRLPYDHPSVQRLLGRGQK